MSSSKPKTLLILNGSPIRGSNTDLLAERIADGARSIGWTAETIFLNDYSILPCQSCGVREDDDICIYHDEIYFAFEKFSNCDAVVAATPIYFDTVSAQLKLFIDRCNCYRPLKRLPDGTYDLFRVPHKRRAGIAVLVGGPRQKYDCALTVIKGFFKWCGVRFIGDICYSHDDYSTGAVSANGDMLRRAYEIGVNLKGLPTEE